MHPHAPTNIVQLADPAPASSSADDFGPDALLLRCSDCDFAAAVTAWGTGLKRHVEKEHGRQPTPAERTPRTQADVDAQEAIG